MHMWAVIFSIYYMSIILSIIYLLLELASLNELSFILSYIRSHTDPFYSDHVILLVEKWKRGH